MQLVHGQLAQDLPSVDESGAFVRKPTTFRDSIEADPAADFAAEAGRYHAYVSYACPWAHRVLIARALRKLEDVVSINIANPEMGDRGWRFDGSWSGSTLDSVLGKSHLYQIYQKARPDMTGRITVPVLWDRKKNVIVNNESSEIMRSFSTAFFEAGFGDPRVDLCPKDLTVDIDAAIDAIFMPINNGVYRCGFARSQTSYDEAFDILFAALDHWDAVLDRQRFMCGSVLTDADICLFTTLLRFDWVYHTHFKCNRNRIIDYPNLYGLLREIYQIPGVAPTCHLDHIKRHYFYSHTSINPRQIVARGPDPSTLEAPHGRDHLKNETAWLV